MENVLEDEDYYVQKGVGWTLRETSIVYSKQMHAFMEKHLASISTTAFAAAVEKIDKKTREKWKEKRKKYRRSKKAR